MAVYAMLSQAQSIQGACFGVSLRADLPATRTHRLGYSSHLIFSSLSIIFHTAHSGQTVRLYIKTTSPKELGARDSTAPGSFLLGKHAWEMVLPNLPGADKPKDITYLPQEGSS